LLIGPAQQHLKELLQQYKAQKIGSKQP